ncbi:MAG: glycoside hydrolase [Acidobacteria bacterium]|nr:glycoside hydrolase [Acidobacteriota bacterium]
MPKNPLCVAFLWHMHQPDYGDEQTGEIYLPWTRFHAIKDYYDMGALIAAVPGFRATINVVPSLLDQLESYSGGRARETYAAVTLRDASGLEEKDRLFLLRAFFQLPWKHMLLPHPRYRELLERRGMPNDRGEYSGGIARYATQDFRDLQVWFNLSWCGNELRKDPLVGRLLRKGKGYTESEKQQLIEVQMKFVGKIIPFYRQLAEDRAVELSVSPYYHPILPLLCDGRSAREVLPDIPLPQNPFSFPADAAEQTRRAQARFRELFGRTPAGMWPSEGAVSEAAVLAVREAGIQWLASDEGVLYHSLVKSGRRPAPLSAAEKCCAYQWKEGGPSLFFRDHELSDRIGFIYSNWSAGDAVQDFLGRLRARAAALPDDGRHYVVPVILDGENAWEHYPNSGADFLLLLYRRLVEAEDLRPVTLSEYLETEGYRAPLPAIAAGSWIYSCLSTWIGHPEKNRAWEALASARQALQAGRSNGEEDDRLRGAFREMLIAEGSDWFWWFGDDHETQNAAEFDTLFRTHVKNVYRLLGHPYPAELDVPIKRVDLGTHLRNPIRTISPKLDGKVTDYFEWLSAGYATPSGGESMHRASRYLEKVYFGYDQRNFYLRIDLTPPVRRRFPPDSAVEISFVSPQACRWLLACDEGRKWRLAEVTCGPEDIAIAFAGGKVLESSVPLQALGIQDPGEVRFFVSIIQGGREVERFPTNGFFTVPVLPSTLDMEEWIV